MCPEHVYIHPSNLILCRNLKCLKKIPKCTDIKNTKIYNNSKKYQNLRLVNKIIKIYNDSNEVYQNQQYFKKKLPSYLLIIYVYVRKADGAARGHLLLAIGPSSGRALCWPIRGKHTHIYVHIYIYIYIYVYIYIYILYI
jgi:hypothetical protein